MMVVEGYASTVDLADDFGLCQHEVVKIVNEAVKMFNKMMDDGYSREYGDQQYEKYIMRKIRALAEKQANEQPYVYESPVVEEVAPVYNEAPRQPAYFYNLADKQPAPVVEEEPVVQVEQENNVVENKDSGKLGSFVWNSIQVGLIAVSCYYGLDFVSGYF